MRIMQVGILLILSLCTSLSMTAGLTVQSSNTGIIGETSSGSATGVIGENTANSGDAIGVSGMANSPTGVGVLAIGNSKSGVNYGLQAMTISPAGYGIYAIANAAGTGVAYAVYAKGNNFDGYSGFFEGRFRVKHLSVDFDGPPFDDDEVIAGVRWPVSIENSTQTLFRGGLRMSDEGFFDVTNKANTLNPNFARLNSTGNWTVVSDRRMKKDMAPLSGTLDRAMALEPISFLYNSETTSGNKQIGFTAQNVREQFPSLVTNGEVLTLNYSGLSVVAIAAIQEQQRVIEHLKAENASLSERLAQIEHLLLE